MAFFGRYLGWARADEVTIGNYLLTMVPLVFFYLYTWSLRYVIGERLAEIKDIRETREAEKQRLSAA